MADKRISQLTAAGTMTSEELVELSQLSTTVTKTATTLSALASDNSYNDSGSGFVTAGFVVGDQVKVTGFTGNVANNIFSATITALTTSKMTIGGTDGNVIVDDAAGESVTITKWTTRRTTAAEVAKTDFTLQVGLSDLITDLTTGNSKAYVRSPRAFTISDIRASLLAASSSGTVTVDINKNGSTILSTKLTVDATEKTSVTAATPHARSSSTVADDDELTFDIDNAGTGAKGLIVTLRGY